MVLKGLSFFLSVYYSAPHRSSSPQVADEWQEYQKRLEYFNEVHRKQTTLIDRLANKVRGVC